MIDSDRVIYRAAFYSTIVMLVVMPLQIAVFAMNPLPTSVVDWFSTFRDRPLVAFFHSDFFLMVDNVLIAVVYVAFYASLRGRREGILRLGLVLGLIGIAAYVSSCKTFELQSLSRLYFSAGSDAEKNAALAAGYAMIASWQGTAFDAYYVLNAIALLAVSYAMLDDSAYGRTTAIIGLVTGVLMIVPSTAGPVGLAFSLLSLIPWYVFAIRFSRVFFRLARGTA